MLIELQRVWPVGSPLGFSYMDYQYALAFEETNMQFLMESKQQMLEAWQTSTSDFERIQIEINLNGLENKIEEINRVRRTRRKLLQKLGREIDLGKA